MIKTKIISLIGMVVAPLVRAIMAIAFKLSNHKQIRIGKCVFRGSDKFVELCQKAMNEFKRLDENSYYAVTNGSNLMFYETPKAFDGPPDIYTIDEEYCAWSSQGVITRVLYASFRSGQISGRVSVPRAEMERIRKDVYDRLFKWLSDHDFAEELTSLFGPDEFRTS